MDITNSDNLNIDLTVPEPETTQPTAPATAIEEPYQPSEADIKFLQKQVSITPEQASQLLLKNNGNYVNALVDFYQVQYKPERIGIAESSHKHNVSSLTTTLATPGSSSRCITLAKLLELSAESSSLININRTFLYVSLNNSYTGFTKKKKYGSVLNVINEIVNPAICIDLTKIKEVTQQINTTGQQLTIYELLGESNTILDKWAMPESGLAFYPAQIQTNKTIVESGMLNMLNKYATQLARYSHIIGENESIIGEAFLISNIPAWE